MTTVVLPPTRRRVDEPHILLPAVGWKVYEALVDAHVPGLVRMTYDRGDLELMSPSPEHEYDAVTLGMIVEVAAEVFGVETVCLRMVTLRRQDLDRGLEPDNCYYTRHWRRISGKKRINLATDPPPDLAIEVDITDSSLPRQAIYAALGVPELWRYDGETIRVLVLGTDRTYAETERSPTFPDLPLSEAVALMDRRPEMHDQAWKNLLRERLRAHTRPGGTP